jgi:hypothetical protein
MSHDRPNTDSGDVLTVVEYSDSGEPTSTAQVNIAIGDHEADEAVRFDERLQHLSGDLDLPLEGQLAGSTNPIAFRVSSDFQNSFTFYYCDNEVIGISLTLLGGDLEPEADMIESIRLLLLDEADDDDPDDDYVDQVLSSPAFSFHTTKERPAHFFIPLAPETDSAQWTAMGKRLCEGDRQLATALCRRAVRDR